MYTTTIGDTIHGIITGTEITGVIILGMAVVITVTDTDIRATTVMETGMVTVITDTTIIPTTEGEEIQVIPGIVMETTITLEEILPTVQETITLPEETEIL